MKSLLLLSICLCGLTLASATPPPPDASSAEPVDHFLDFYGKTTGKKVIADNRVAGVISCNISPDTPEEKKVELIEKLLFLNGFTLIDSGPDTVEVLGPGTMARLAGLPLYTKPEELPRGERVFSYLFKLEHRDAREVAALLQQFIPPGNDTAFNPDVNSRTLLVTGRTTVVRNVIRLMPTLDVPAAPIHSVRRDEEEPAPTFGVTPRAVGTPGAGTPERRGNFLLTLTFSDMDVPPVVYKAVFTSGKVQLSPSDRDMDFTVTADAWGDEGFTLDYTLRLSARADKKPRMETYTARVEAVPGKTIPVVQSPDKTISLRIERADPAGNPGK